MRIRSDLKHERSWLHGAATPLQLYLSYAVFSKGRLSQYADIAIHPKKTEYHRQPSGLVDCDVSRSGGIECGVCNPRHLTEITPNPGEMRSNVSVCARPWCASFSFHVSARLPSHLQISLPKSPMMASCFPFMESDVDLGQYKQVAARFAYRPPHSSSYLL
ncbi:hypothetical protein NMY22_g3033 [Coprinellus aureogranulatus]|nr:hypothetical protein NMY22_g3033 [Coprinellus aureogranulatus]